MVNRILRMKTVVEQTGLPRPTIYDHMKRGLFPKPIPLGPRAIGWLAEDIEAWKADRIKHRDAQAA